MRAVLSGRPFCIGGGRAAAGAFARAGRSRGEGIVKKVGAHQLGIDQGSLLVFQDFEDGGPMWTGQGARELRREVLFSEGFRQPPSVHVSLSMFDVDHRQNFRADVSAEEIGRDGFTLVFRTWGDTRIARVRADWLAMGPVRAEDDWDVE